MEVTADIMPVEDRACAHAHARTHTHTHTHRVIFIEKYVNHFSYYMEGTLIK